MSSLELACLPKSGPAVTGPGERAVGSSPEDMRMPLCACANVGYADLFCFAAAAAASATLVFTRSDSGRPLIWKPAEGGVVLALPADEPSALSCVRFAEMRARSELETSFGSLFVLDERARPSGFVGGGAPSAPGGPPEAGSSVWMKQHLLPYGQEPETQNVCTIRKQRQKPGSHGLAAG